MAVDSTCVCLLGPASTGKTTLACALASEFGGVWLPEYCRQVMTTADISEDDLAAITHEQFAREDDFLASLPSVGILDTDVVTLFHWWDVQFGKVPSVVSERVQRQAERFYLLTLPDLPLEPDPLRDDGIDRAWLYRRYRATLVENRFRFCEVSGIGEARLQQAISACRSSFLS